MSKSIIDLINTLEPARVGYEHLALAPERDLSEVLLEIRDDLASLLKAYDAIQEERNDSEEELDELENSSSYKDAEMRQDMLDNWIQGEADIADRLVPLLRKEN